MVAHAQNASGFTIDGLWLTDGYGELIDIKRNSLQIYEVTGVSCIAAGTAKRRPGTRTGEIVFEGGSTGMLRLTPGEVGGTLSMHAGGVSGVALRRTTALPETCSRKTPDTPESNYEVFWQTFSEQYPFFALRKIDWTAVDKEFRPRVTGSTSPSELFQILRQMIEPFSDAHTGIVRKCRLYALWGIRQNVVVDPQARVSSGRSRTVRCAKRTSSPDEASA
jgi:hypothetical protein